MRKLALLVAICSAVSLGSYVVAAAAETTGAAAPTTNEDGKKVHPSRLIVKKDREVQVRGVGRGDLASKKKNIESEAGVEYVEYDRDLGGYTEWVPNDPKRASQDNMAGVAAYNAWDVNRGSGVTIAVLDSGCRASHEDLGTKILYQYDAVNGDSVADDVDDHGTLVASIAAAKTNNSLGIVGGAPAATIACIKVVQNGTPLYTSNIVTGLQKAYEAGAKVVNLSIGYTTYSQAVQDKILEHQDHYVVVASAGNTDQRETVKYPASLDKVVAVSGTTEDGAAFWADSRLFAALFGFELGPLRGCCRAGHKRLDHHQRRQRVLRDVLRHLDGSPSRLGRRSLEGVPFPNRGHGEPPR